MFWFLDDNQKDMLTKRELELNYFCCSVYGVCTSDGKKELIGSEGIMGRVRGKHLPGSIKWFHESEMYHPVIFEFEDMYVSGYFVCEKYYGDILCELR